MKKVLIVFGTRPEAIKMAPLVNKLKNSPDFETKVCVTGQHREMLYQVLDLFEIVPDYDLNIMSPNQDLFDITTKVLLGIRQVLNEYSPELVLVHGDTSTCFAASLAAFYKQIKIGHVEAGLRTYNLQSPWPEEMNRQLTDRIATYYFAPTCESAENLRKEMVDENKIFITGNTVIDALVNVSTRLDIDASLQQKARENILNSGYDLKRKRDVVLITGHRRENFGQGFLNICEAIKLIAKKKPDVDFVYPVHLNPNVREIVFQHLSHLDNVFLISPLDYLPFVLMMKCSKVILTDSGGIQEEAPSLGIPVLVMRDTTERPEAVAEGTVILCGTNVSTIESHTLLLLNSKEEYKKMSMKNNPYGDGNACDRIINALK